MAVAEQRVKQHELHWINWRKTYPCHTKKRLHEFIIHFNLVQTKTNKSFWTWSDRKLHILSYVPFFSLSSRFVYRNRLESNSEHWNALLLSLRELTEWVIRKDTELSQLRSGPLRGDAASLQKQLVSFSILKLFDSMEWMTEQQTANNLSFQNDFVRFGGRKNHTDESFIGLISVFNRFGEELHQLNAPDVHETLHFIQKRSFYECNKKYAIHYMKWFWIFEKIPRKSIRPSKFACWNVVNCTNPICIRKPQLDFSVSDSIFVPDSLPLSPSHMQL